MVLEKTLESPLGCTEIKSVLNIHWKDWCWSWNSNTLATWCEELTHLKRPWFWERLKVGGEGDDRGWGGWMASPTQWTWVWVSSRSWRWTGRPGVLQSMRSQRVGHDRVTELNWTEWQSLPWIWVGSPHPQWQERGERIQVHGRVGCGLVSGRWTSVMSKEWM